MNSSRVCVDASVIIPALVPHELSGKAEALLLEWQSDRIALVAPSLLGYEVASTVRRFVRFGLLPATAGEQAIAQWLEMPIRLSSRRRLFSLAFRLANQYDRPRAYDAAYLALAQLNDCEFWTADEKLYNAVRDELDWVRWLGNYAG